MRKLSLAVGLSLTLYAGSVSAADWYWNGAAGDGLWGTPGNWTSNSVPPIDCINVWLGGGNTQTIAPGDMETPGLVWNANVNPRTNYGSIFGPEFGGTLNIHGTLYYDWVVAAVAANPAARAHLNLYSSCLVTGVNLAIGNTWWYQGGALRDSEPVRRRPGEHRVPLVGRAH